MENKPQYTEAQIQDIRAREKEALEHLKRLQLSPACQIVKEKLPTDVGDVFADRLYPYLADTKYTPGEVGIPSPYLNDPDKKA